MSDSPEELLSRVAAMKKQLKNFRILGADGVTIHGSMQHGYAVDTDGGGGGGAGGGGGDIFGCTDPSATNYNPAATVDDGSCTFGSCPDITVICDSITASLAKCGFFNVDDGKYYLTTTYDNSYDGSSCPNGCDGVNTWYVQVADTVSVIAHSDYHLDADYNCVFDGDVFENVDVIRSCFCDCGPKLITDPPCFGCETDLAFFCSGCYDPLNYPAFPICGSFPNTPSYVNEYTTAELISNTEAALPLYDNSFTGSCSASRNLDSAAINYEIHRFKPKFIFSSSGINFTLGYNEHFVPDVGSPSDTPRSISVGIGATEALGLEVLEPSTNGTITITDIICTPV